MDAVPGTHLSRLEGNRWRPPSVPLISLLVTGYFLALTPHAFRYIKHHPDERHYTDAAVEMLRSGDYWTPKTPAGDVRLNKPILTYWLVAGSYRLSGVSPLTSRLPFLFVGAGVVWLTYRLAWYVFANREAGYLAAMLVACQPALLVSSPRSVPDVLLTFFQLVSVFGFARLLREPQARWTALAWAYGGSALAVMTKGLPAAVFACYAMLLLVWFRSEQILRNWQKHVAAGWAASLLGLSWFGLMYHIHGDLLWTQFFGDQVVHRVNTSTFSAAKDVPSVLLLIGLCFLPCWRPLGEALRVWRARRNGALLPRDPVCLLLATWTLIYLLLASCVDRVNVRYQCPIVPLVSVLAAGLLVRLQPDRLRSWLKSVGRGAATLLLIVSVLGIGICLTSTEQVATVCVVGLLGCGWAIGFLRRAPQMAWQQVGSGAVLTFLMASHVAGLMLVSVSGPSTDERLWSQIQATQAADSTIAFVTKPSYPSRLRVISGATADFCWIGHDLPTSELAMVGHEALVLSEEAAAQIDLANFGLYRLENGLKDVSLSDVAKATFAGELSQYLQQHRRFLTLAVRTQPARKQRVDVVHTASRLPLR